MFQRPAARNQIVCGVLAPPPRPTRTAALLAAMVLSLPFLSIALVEIALRW